jgi:hypothetical protein
MKSFICVIALLVCACVPARPASAGHWLRRATLAAACAASFWDVQTTRTAIARGAREGNGFFADTAGYPRWGRMIGFKVGVCGGSILAEELLFRRSRDVPWTGLNTGLAAFYSTTAVHNIRVANHLLRTQAAPAGAK